MSLLPAYMSELWKSYEQMHREDLSLFDVNLLSVDPLSCHISVLPFLAWEADVNIDGFSESVQRDLVAGAFRALQYAGTKGALENALDAFTDVNVIEWFKDGADPFTFKVDLSINKDVEITTKVTSRVTEIAHKRKNARSQISELLLSYRVNASLSFASGGVGEAKCSAIPLEGYEEILPGQQHIYVGGVGEVSSYAQMEVL
jgi:phage tail P2-like protein